MTQEEENWNFDFSEYQQEEEEENQIDTINTPPPKITRFRAKLSNTIQEQEHLTQKIIILTELISKTATYPQDTHHLWKHYGHLYSYWTLIKDIYGQTIQTEIETLFTQAKKELQKKGQIPETTHNTIIKIHDTLMKLRQLSGLGIDVEKTSRSIYTTTKNKILEG